tara:strand:- start:463 stop:1080 length:618 start_codon:yes stop_codon:yes gene_type:complete
MSNMTEVVGKSSVNHYFDPSQEQSKIRLAQGVYPANIIKCESTVRSVKGKYKARIFNYRIKVHESVRTRVYQIEDIDGSMKDVDSSGYIGREIRSQGVFFFLTPDVGDDFEANPGGNRKFMETVEALGIKCPEVEIDVNGEKRTVKTLPDLDESAFLGVPVLANVGLGKPWKGSDGVERQSFEVKSIDLWEQGVKVDVEAAELPF